jgi:hypothetical protein
LAKKAYYLFYQYFAPNGAIRRLTDKMLVINKLEYLNKYR